MSGCAHALTPSPSSKTPPRNHYPPPTNDPEFQVIRPEWVRNAVIRKQILRQSSVNQKACINDVILFNRSPFSMCGQQSLPLFHLLVFNPHTLQMSFEYCPQARARVGLPPNVLRYFRAKRGTSETKRSRRRCQIDRQARSLLRAFRVSPL